MRILYISLFTLLGVLVQFVIHSVVEQWYIKLLISDFEKYSLGWLWDVWFSIHYVGSIILLAVGIIAGYYLGKYWWGRIYEKKQI
ncbi:MAG: hypothetical protein A3B91_02305 [Candidatus Yanofskybacteria bacterium RIFCSPHIGHO2_02_FULL_41_29]|uniref:Uncharacterized protein n=1 Tax=Candidatus Yanofskybacteria bacterium RIFCSPHIGHO2_01_FULL_41_53 TaxID=1802663 RepID=A0A1F8EIG5_9BACT|nr:MAG: hypothetical protein A2650_01730 [Candidatus Yanofskybacteria bacterium RIFCSPHIGHO2_01_FULL_41_53]OGN12357.1 MAG: hypothetical protein A3B91_02305 [Candidatus Yanofskybacteria bacterium RIFCSPHIGHO2_02_FULL_41_29]OGN17206.1 MAG: hypothetical protein A3F48_00205 [Candidatus Yanofskybacteria bacterium RIFCSPHIGHO2_12_FULL_41_9]OGN23223.1 MAG: hypothetical protein A2916_02720 [Candidatus Yanofskybacteria bacterium RIFCSPLOWO2_01_FULL_41_67]OGN28880.1 MAG: hypothetical protein A3H54_01920 